MRASPREGHRLSRRGRFSFGKGRAARTVRYPLLAGVRRRSIIIDESKSTSLRKKKREPIAKQLCNQLG